MHKAAAMDTAGAINTIIKNNAVWTGLMPMVTGRGIGMITGMKEGMAG